MKNRLQSALLALESLENDARQESLLHRTDARAKLLTTMFFLATMLSLPLARLSEILLYALFPILTAAMGGMRYASVLRKSLLVLPFVALVGMFNLFYDRTPAFRLGTFTVTEGWISFLSILLRGLLATQALLVLVGSTGIHALCRSMQRLGMPRILAVQLLFVYRYLYVLLDEARRMAQAREARSYGRCTFPLRMWGPLVGQLLIRTFDRAEQIHRAMLARGFDGSIPDCAGTDKPWRRQDTVFLTTWSTALLLARLCRPVETLSRLLR
ncbi:MAG: cobalt ECF transporter T component CbiQ [Alistipes sp.]|nr:cobalt ECF transporter T component CbiQ [Alistipes sp.]